MGSINHFQAIRPDTAYLKKIIESSLLAEWAIRIEYQTGDSDDSCWQLWDKTYFAIRSAKPVLETLLNCYTKHPKCTIRICAEKYRPQTRILYTVYNPQHLPAETESIPLTKPMQSPREQEHVSTQIRIIA